MTQRRRRREIGKVLIANRGEIALRIVRSLRALGLRSVVAHSDVDGDALPVRLADEAECIGGAAATDSYLRIDRIIDAARRSGADAVHPGYGFLAESADLARAVESAGLEYLGPTPENVALLGDKARAREVLREAGIPPVPGSDRTLRGGRELHDAARRIGFPLLLKAVAGGGGKGIRLVRAEDELDTAFTTASSEAASSFGAGALLAERFIEGARHVEVQVLGDGRGGVRLFVERDCSTQRRLQKLLEETPCPVLDATTRRRLLSAAGAAVAGARYRSLGTLEFLLAPDGELFFLEMNTRIQVEHGITECVSGVDLVREQLHVARGATLERWDGDPERHVAPWNGAAVEFRINAEDPRFGFRPASGRVETMVLPAGPGVRVDTALEPGCNVLPHYDPLIAKVIGFGCDREEALARLRVALGETEIGPLPTTLSLGRRLAEDTDVAAARNHCQWLETRMQDARYFPGPLGGEDLLCAAAAAAWFRHERAVSKGAAARSDGGAAPASVWRSRSRWCEEA